jgi:hypothetical protein
LRLNSFIFSILLHRPKRRMQNAALLPVAAVAGRPADDGSDVRFG